MKKTLLIAAAALAASVISSQAQVYSQNIVGYVNKPFVTGYVNVSNPLDNSGGNSLTNVVQNVGGALDGVLVYLWNGTGYTIRQFDSSSATGVSDLGGSPVASPTLDPGSFAFLNNNSGVLLTNTFVGVVHVEGAGTGSVGRTTNVLATGFNFVGSKISVGGGLTTSLGLTNPAGVLDGVLVYTPNINGSGAFLGYVITQFDSSAGSGFSDLGGSPTTEPQVSVSSGVIINNNTGSAYSWTQNL